MPEKSLYDSVCTAKNLWQEYHIFGDRVEFDTHFGTLVIPFSQIESVRVSRSDVVGLLHGDLQLKGFRPALKIDWANLFEHVVIDKKRGIRRILFTPENIEEFKQVLDQALAQYQGS